MKDPTDRRTFVYRVNMDGTIVFVSDDWVSFDEENGTHLESSDLLNRLLWDFISNSDVREVYKMLLSRVQRNQEQIFLPYRCDSPDCRRYMEMEISFLPSKLIEFKSRIVKTENREHVPFLDLSQERSDKFLSICSWCKKVRVDDDCWEEVEEAVQKLHLFDSPQLPNLTHGICPPCAKSFEEEEF